MIISSMVVRSLNTDVMRLCLDNLPIEPLPSRQRDVVFPAATRWRSADDDNMGM